VPSNVQSQNHPGPDHFQIFGFRNHETMARRAARHERTELWVRLKIVVSKPTETEPTTIGTHVFLVGSLRVCSIATVHRGASW
jgi:hypothetical protein